jgi:hypothetical protein
LTFVDLAGAERAARTQLHRDGSSNGVYGGKGQRLKESTTINVSLMRLGRCLTALRNNQVAAAAAAAAGERAPRPAPVPWRESQVRNYCIALHCITLHCIALHCIALQCIVNLFAVFLCIIHRASAPHPCSSASHSCVLLPLLFFHSLFLFNVIIILIPSQSSYPLIILLNFCMTSLGDATGLRRAHWVLSIFSCS